MTQPGVGPSFDAAEMLAHGVLVGRAGAGFPSAVHLERFASPARLCVTDEPRLAGVGGAGMLSIVVAPGQLGQALAHGTVWMRPPRSVQVLLSGRVRPFVCARDVALELIRRGLGDVVRRVETQHRGPVVLEFAGPSVRLLCVGERSVLAGLAPQLGAVASLFTSDERTEVFLRDQRRSKAHRALLPDAGAPCDEVVNLNLAAVNPLLLDETGTGPHRPRSRRASRSLRSFSVATAASPFAISLPRRRSSSRSASPRVSICCSPFRRGRCSRRSRRRAR